MNVEIWFEKRDIKKQRKLRKHIFNVEVRIDDWLGSLFEEMNGMLLKIRVERNQTENECKFLRKTRKDYDGILEL
jgi:hypothetical protein